MGYVAMRQDGQVDIPLDVAEKYKKIATEEFHQKRRCLNWILDCFAVMMKLYGVMPIENTLDLVNVSSEYQFDKNKLQEYIKALPPIAQLFVQKGDLLVFKELCIENDYLELLDEQQGYEFYIPTEQEIAEIVDDTYLSRNPYAEKFVNYLQKKSWTREDAQTFVRMLQRETTLGCGVEEMLEIVEEFIEFKNEKDFSRFLSILQGLRNNTRLQYNRGFTSQELVEKEYNSAKNSNEVMAFKGANRQRLAKKVYPNDQCPCGSGRKFKHCCALNGEKQIQ